MGSFLTDAPRAFVSVSLISRSEVTQQKAVPNPTVYVALTQTDSVLAPVHTLPWATLLESWGFLFFVFLGFFLFFFSTIVIIMCSLLTNLRSTQTEIDQLRKAGVYFEKMVNSEDQILSSFFFFFFFSWHNVISRGCVVPEWNDVAVYKQARAESHRPGCEEWLRC